MATVITESKFVSQSPTALNPADMFPDFSLTDLTPTADLEVLPASPTVDLPANAAADLPDDSASEYSREFFNEMTEPVNNEEEFGSELDLPVDPPLPEDVPITEEELSLEDIPTEDAPQDIPMEDAPQDVTTEDAPQDVTTEDAPQDVTTEDAPEDVLTEDIPEVTDDKESEVKWEDEVASVHPPEADLAPNEEQPDQKSLDEEDFEEILKELEAKAEPVPKVEAEHQIEWNLPLPQDPENPEVEVPPSEPVHPKRFIDILKPLCTEGKLSSVVIETMQEHSVITDEQAEFLKSTVNPLCEAAADLVSTARMVLEFIGTPADDLA
jgi:hypothetical protein